MRFSPQEISGSRVRLRYGVELEYEVAGPSDFLLNVHAARTRRQRVVDEFFSIVPHRDVSLPEDTVSGNRIAAFAVASGTIVVTYAALVEIVHKIMDPADIVAEMPSALPVHTLRYLYPSRYCQADLVQQWAWNTFGGMARGYEQVRSVRNWVQQSLKFQVGASRRSTSAVDTMREGVGVCRDFAHTMIACCRALNYPARFVTGVDYGADPALGPQDFHAYVEVFLGGSWYLFDPTGISPTTGLLRIGTGRDAADVSFATIFGPARTGMPNLTIDAGEDATNGFALPARTDLAISTAD
jgi:transglutaminase-like putative cysteine protease